MAKDRRREKGTGGLFQRGDRYVAQVQDGYNESGRPKYKQVTCKTKTEAVKALKDMIAKQTLGQQLQDRRGQTLSNWIQLWLEDHIKPNREPKTYQYYRGIVNIWILPNLERVHLSELRAPTLSKLLSKVEEKGATPNTVANVRKTLRACLGVAVKQGLIHENPAVRTTAPKVSRSERTFFEPKHLTQLLEALEGSPIENLFRFSLATGVRIGEATGVTWDCVDLDNKVVLITSQLQRIDSKLTLKPLKTSKSRRCIPLNEDSLSAILKEQDWQISIKSNKLGLVFLNPKGNPFDPKYVNKYLHRALEKASLPFAGMHALRHTAATLLLREGLNLHTVSRLLGHSQISMTADQYGHVLTDGFRDAVDILQRQSGQGAN